MARFARCRDCGAAVSKKASACPKCGCPLKKRLGCISGCFTILLVAFILAVLIGLLLPMRPTPLPQAPNVEAGKAHAEANDQTGQAENDATLAKIEETFKKRGIPLLLRLEIFQLLCLAEDRAQWEADRLYPMIDHFQENMRYHDEMTPKYEKPINDKYHLTEDENTLIATEANIRKWPLPQKSALDLPQLARGMKVTVYANRGDHTYHRKVCALLDGGRPTVSMSLYEAISNLTEKPCHVCAP
jgi:hypothetical protein